MDILDLAVNMKIVQKSGAWFSYNETRLGQGRDNSKIFLKENQEICDEIEKLVLDKVAVEGMLDIDVDSDKYDGDMDE